MTEKEEKWRGERRERRKTGEGRGEMREMRGEKEGGEKTGGGKRGGWEGGRGGVGGKERVRKGSL